MIIMYARIVKILTVAHGNRVAMADLTLCVELQEMIAIDGSLIIMVQDNVMVNLLPSVVSPKEEYAATMLHGIT